MAVELASLVIKEDGTVEVVGNDGAPVFAFVVTDTEASPVGFTQEQIEDFIGLFVTGNTETRIAVTYDDAAGKFNFVVTDETAATVSYTPGDAGLWIDADPTDVAAALEQLIQRLNSAESDILDRQTVGDALTKPISRLDGNFTGDDIETTFSVTFDTEFALYGLIVQLYETTDDTNFILCTRPNELSVGGGGVSVTFEDPLPEGVILYFSICGVEAL